ncbi:MAG: hypothetical protein NC081_01820 [Roseburia sp.]|nr:hypothetical protein [Roseburia sp.]
MRRVTEYICTVLGRVLFIGLSIQIIMGLLWMCGNLTGFQEFGESYLYLQAGENLICDEYTGILYPLFLVLVRAVAALLSLPYYTLVYVCQLAAACYGGYRFWKSLGKIGRFFPAWGTLSLLTLPAAMQCHLAVLPDSFAGTALLLELSFLWELIKRKRKENRALAGLGITYLAGTLLMPDYVLFGAVPVLIGLVFGIFVYLRSVKKRNGNQKRLVLGLCTLGLCLAGIGVLGPLTQTRGSYGRARRTPELMALSRFAGSCLEDTYGYWPEDLKACLSEEEIRRSSQYAGDVWQVFGKAVQERLGMERADEVFRQVAEAGYQVYYVRVRHDLVWDLASYTFSPFFLQLQLADRGYSSYSGRNYDIMRMKEPVLTRYYVNYGSWWFAAGLALAGLWQLVYWADRLLWKKKLWNGRNIALCCCCFAIGGSMVLWYTLQGAGMMDYKNTVPVALFWMMWMTAAAQRAR